MQARLTCLTKNKQLLELFGLYDELAGDYVNGATDLTATLEIAGAAATNGFSGIALSYVTGSNGDYVAAIDSNVTATPGTTYVTHVLSVATGIDLQLPTTVKARDSIA